MSRTPDNTPPDKLPRRHGTRLRQYWRGMGWAAHDNIDLDLLRWALVTEQVGDRTASRLALTPAGRAAVADSLDTNRGARSVHARYVAATARHLADSGRLVFTELSVRTVHDGRWRACRPDVFSLVPGLRADHLAPQVHEIKVSRADLMGELRNAKIERYRELAASIYFVLKDGIATLDDIPAAYGVAICDPTSGLRIARAAPIGDYQIETRHWMALAKAHPFEPPLVEPAQRPF